MTSSQQNQDNLPEKEKVNVYDNDEAYMLNDDKENAYLEEEGQTNENLDSPHDDVNFEGENDELDNDMNLEYNNDIEEDNMDAVRGKDEEDGTVRNQLENEDNLEHNRTSNKKERGMTNQNNQLSNLITLKYISVCQCCKENFNSNTNVPFLLKCGHFFCRNCLENNFTGEDGSIFCPDDGMVANNIGDLKLLNNLIIDRTVDDEDDIPSSSRETGFCQIHPDQKLSHYVEDTREVICVYCAFTKFKKNPKYEIKEIRDKCQEILTDVDKLLGDNQHYVEILQQTLKDIKDNKSVEEDRIANLYDEVIKYLEEKKSEMFESINNIFASNADKLSEKLDYFSGKMEDAEELKAHVVAVMNNSSTQINEVMERYTQFLRENADSNKLNLELVEFKFAHDDENKLIKYLNNFGDLKSKTKYIRFHPKNSNNYSVSNNTPNQNNNVNSYNYNPQTFASDNSPGNVNVGSSNFNMDYQFRNMNLGNSANLNSNIPNSNNLSASKKNYESNFTANNKYPNLYQNDVLNTSELLNENNEYLAGRINSQKPMNNSYGGSKDLLTSDPNFRPSSSKNPSMNYPNLNRQEVTSKYSYNRGNNNNNNASEYSYEPKNRDFNFSGSNNMSKTPDSTGKLKK